jgi:hypothetical protein
MNKYIFLAFAIITFSCSKEKESDSKKDFDFSYSLDTVHIDSKGDFFFLNYGLAGSALGKGGKLYTFNDQKLRLDIIDLDKGELVDSVKFEVEGPTGIGALGVDMINLSDAGEFYFSSFTGIRNMDANGNLKRTLNWDSDDQIQVQLRGQKMISFDGIVAPDGSKFYGTYSAQGRGGSSMADGLAIIDLNTLKLKTIEVPKLSGLMEFTIELELDGMKNTKGDNFSLLLNESKIIISQSSINGISIYDLTNDSLLTYDYQTELLPSEKPGKFERKVANMEEYQEAARARNKEPEFGDFMYDSDHKLYYRVSFLKEPKADGAIERKGILTIFDEDFKQLHEQEGMGSYAGRKFVKNGKIYRFINIDDEMAFEVLTPKFTDD